MPVVTLFLTGIIMTAATILSALLHRLCWTGREPEDSERLQQGVPEGEAENNKYKIKKLTEEQPKIMKKSMEMSTTQMKLMP